MVGRVTAKAKKCMMWLLNFVRQNKWNHPHMRCVLSDVFVRSVMQFGAPVWAIAYMDRKVGDEHRVVQPLYTLHRQLLRALLGVDKRIPNYCLYVISGRTPVHVVLQKLCLRYYERVSEIPEGDNTYRTLHQVSEWACGAVDGDRFDIGKGREFVEKHGNVGSLYEWALDTLSQSMGESTYLSLGCTQELWC